VKTTAMNEEEFWAIIDGATIDINDEFFLENHYLSFWNALETLNIRELEAFAERFRLIKKSVEVIDETHQPVAGYQLINVAAPRFSDLLDGLISRGEAVFKNALSDPGSIELLPRKELLGRCEAFAHAPVALAKLKNAGFTQGI
jgi:hypothetical protein